MVAYCCAVLFAVIFLDVQGEAQAYQKYSKDAKLYLQQLDALQKEKVDLEQRLGNVCVGCCVASTHVMGRWPTVGWRDCLAH